MRAKRIDNTATALVAYARSLGFLVHLIGGTLDALLWHPLMGHRVYAVDFKSKGGTLTPDQVKLVAAGWPVMFVSAPAQLDAMMRDLEG